MLAFVSQKSAVRHLALVAASAPHLPFPVTAGGIKTWFAPAVWVLLGECVGQGHGACLAGSSLLGAESGLEGWLQSALNREA